MSTDRGLPAFAAGPVGAVVAGLVVVLTALSGRYGFHRDELYFLVAGRHPDWGYVDQPPLTPLLARLSTAVFGESPAGLRVIATLAGAGIVVLVAMIARELGGGRAAQTLAACCATASGYVLVLGHMVSTATFDLLCWMTICWLALRLLRTRDTRWWVPLGAVTGLGLQNKYLVLLLVAALLAGLLLTEQRVLLRSRWLLAGIAAAAVVAAPNLWWQSTHDWPQLTVARGISSDDGGENRAMFVPLQLLQLSPFLVPVWVAGLVRLWRSPDLRWARPLAFAYPVLAGLVLVTGGKPYYALSLLLVMTAAGCEPVIAWVRRGRGGVRRVLVATGLVLAFASSAVITLPVLPPGGLGPVQAINKEQGEQAGWPQLVTDVADAWNRIPAAERSRAVILTSNYGQAGALDRYGPGHGLPAPYSGHMSFADWGPPPDSADGPVLLVHQAGGAALERAFTGCREVGRVDNGLDLDNEEQGSLIVLCSSPSRPWSTLWPSLRQFY